MTDKWLTTAELSRELSIPASTLRQWRSDGIGPAGTKLEGSVRYSRAKVDAWIAEQEARENQTKKARRAA
jgi:DNA-binding transcriptional MerR regulator